MNKNFVAIVLASFVAVFILLASSISVGGHWWHATYKGSVLAVGNQTVETTCTLRGIYQYVTIDGKSTSDSYKTWANAGLDNVSHVFSVSKTLAVIGLILSILFVVASCLRPLSPRLEHNIRALVLTRFFDVFLIVHTLAMAIVFGYAAYHFSHHLPKAWQMEYGSYSTSCQSGNFECGTFSGEASGTTGYWFYKFASWSAVWGPRYGWIWTEVAMTGSIIAVIVNIIAMVTHGESDYSSI